MFDTTIAAIATPLAVGGVGMVRISGPNAYDVAKAVFDPISKKDIAKQKGYTALFGHVMADGKMIDEAVALFYRAPKSFTGEDVVEITCHGGVYLVRELLRACLDNGAVMAGPGEFSKRAFLNGKLDLTRAEATVDLINARTGQSAAAALSVMDGHLYKTIVDIRNVLMDLAAQMAAYVDYPDEEIPDLEPEALEETLKECERKLGDLIANFDRGALIREGINTTIVGKPNVGKSTLMNLLAGKDKSIVTQIAGTTRDVVEDTVILGDAILNLADTAGIRQTEDVVEQIGVDKAYKYLSSAQLVLAVFDGSKQLNEDDLDLLGRLDMPAVIIVNKSDLEQKIDMAPLHATGKRILTISAKDSGALKELELAINECLNLADLDLSAGVLANERQLQSAKEAHRQVGSAVEALQYMMTYDAVAINIDMAIEALFDLTGERASEEIISRIFENFCVGK